MKLKTLKDLYENKTDKEIVMVKELRAEAIKWVKGMREDMLRGKDFKMIDEEAFMEFFNITEEDLK